MAGISAVQIAERPVNFLVGPGDRGLGLVLVSGTCHRASGPSPPICIAQNRREDTATGRPVLGESSFCRWGRSGRPCATPNQLYSLCGILILGVGTIIRFGGFAGFGSRVRAFGLFGILLSGGGLVFRLLAGFVAFATIVGLIEAAAFEDHACPAADQTLKRIPATLAAFA